jgi:NADPH:quinone reductase-like Zn-dependent oxidoreductase
LTAFAPYGETPATGRERRIARPLSIERKRRGDIIMRAIIKQKNGGPEVLHIEELPIPEVDAEHVVVKVHAFGLNHAETYVRQGIWPFPSRVLGIECAGEVHEDGTGRLRRGQRVVALMGGMGRTIHGSYEEYVRVPATNVAAVETDMSWTDLAALPEVYATAWSSLHANLAIAADQTLVVRGGTSAVGQAAINIARVAGARVFATTRDRRHFGVLESLGASPLVEAAGLPEDVRKLVPTGVDAVYDLVGATTMLASLTMVRPGGRVCVAGWLGGLEPVTVNPLTDLPSGAHLSLFGSFVYGTPGHPLSDVDLQTIVDRAARGEYRAKPVRVIAFEDIVEGHRLLDAGTAKGKIVVNVTGHPPR